MQQALQPYNTTVWWTWLLEAGGALVILAFAHRKSLFRAAPASGIFS